MSIDIDKITRSLAARADEAPPAIASELWTALEPELRRRAERRRRSRGLTVAALMVLCFAGGWLVARMPVGAADAPFPAVLDGGAPVAEDPLVALQRSGSEFVASLAAIRASSAAGDVDPRLQAWAEISGLTLLNGAATELARMSDGEGLPAELARLSAPQARAVSDREEVTDEN